MTTCPVQASGTIELYFYGELDELSSMDAERHLARCPECRDFLGELRTISSALAARPEVSDPPGGDWSGFMADLERVIRSQPRPSDPGRAARGGTWNRFVEYAAMAALFALVTASVTYVVRSRSTEVADRGLAGSQPTSPLAAESGSNRWTDQAAFASLSEQHFERSKLVVLSLANKDPHEAAGAPWEYERDLASTLLTDTRLYREAAEDRGMTALARTMADLELVLLQASLSSDFDRATLEQIQSLIRKRDLVTKMNVVPVGM